MSYHCYLHNWASPSISCPSCGYVQHTTTNGATIPSLIPAVLKDFDSIKVLGLSVEQIQILKDYYLRHEGKLP